MQLLANIETDRLLLRKYLSADFTPLSLLLGNAKVMKWLFTGHTMSSSEATSFIATHFHFGDYDTGLGTLCEKRTGEVIGFAGIIPFLSIGNEEWELGVALSEQFWNKGYATEIGIAQIDYGFETLEIERIYALAHLKNTSSQRVLKKIGMRFLKQFDIPQRGPRCVYVAHRPD